MTAALLVLLSFCACAHREQVPAAGPAAVETPRAVPIEGAPARSGYTPVLEAFLRGAGLDPAPDTAEAREAAARLAGLLEDMQLEAKPLRQKDLENPDGEAAAQARAAVTAFAWREDIKALLLASAALGENPGQETFRSLLLSLSKRTSLPVVQEDIVPRKALVQLKLHRAEEAFFQERFGAAAQACQEALWLEPKNPKAWEKLGSARLAVGELEKARRAYSEAMSIDPNNEELKRFLARKGWTQ